MYFDLIELPFVDFCFFDGQNYIGKNGKIHHNNNVLKELIDLSRKPSEYLLNYCGMNMFSVSHMDKLFSSRLEFVSINKWNKSNLLYDIYKVGSVNNYSLKHIKINDNVKNDSEHVVCSETDLNSLYSAIKTYEKVNKVSKTHVQDILLKSGIKFN
jgi:hypothetical protein